MALVRSLPPGSRFVVSAYLTFVQAYLSRNLVDSLPNVMAKMRVELEKEMTPAGRGHEEGSVWEQDEPGEPTEG
jgi:hypothetical protein